MARPGPDGHAPLWFRVMRWAAGFAVALFILLGYVLLSTWNVDRFTDGGLPARALWTRLDRAVPIVPEAIWPYALYYVLVMMPLFAVRRMRELGEVISAYLLVTVSAWVVYALWPVRMEYPHLVCGGRFSCEVLLRLWSMDMGVNVMPSLHAAHSALAAAIFWSYRSRVWPLIALGAAAVSIAAVLTRQHYILDIVAGVALALAVWALVRAVFRALWPARARVSGAVHDDSEAVYAAAVRGLTFEQKLRASEVLRDTAWKMAAATVRRAHPEWTESDVEQQVREVFLRGSA